ADVDAGMQKMIQADYIGNRRASALASSFVTVGSWGKHPLQTYTLFRKRLQLGFRMRLLKVEARWDVRENPMRSSQSQSAFTLAPLIASPSWLLNTERRGAA